MPIYLLALALLDFDPSTVADRLLYRNGGEEWRVRIEKSLLERSNGAALSFYTAVFLTRQGTRVVREVRKDLEASFEDEAKWKVGRFTGGKSSQLFISLYSGPIFTYVLSFDGQSVKALYQRTEGRVPVEISRAGKSPCTLTEGWPSGSWEGEPWSASLPRSKKAVERKLVWNGRAIVHKSAKFV